MDVAQIVKSTQEQGVAAWGRRKRNAWLYRRDCGGWH